MLPNAQIRFSLSLRGPVSMSLALGVLAVTLCVACGDTAGTEDDENDDSGGGPPPSSACSAAPGTYQAVYTAVADNCGGVAALPSDRFSINDEGEILTASGQAPGDDSAPSGCVDSDATVDRCTVTFTRQCASEDLLGGLADVQGNYQLDFESRSGAVQITIGLYDGSTLVSSCSAQQRISITR